MNSIIVTGNLCRETMVKYTTTGKLIANNSVADNYGKDNNASCIFWNLVAWEEVGTKLDSFKKGELVEITGYITENKYKNKEGVEVKQLQINVKDIQKKLTKKQQESKEQLHNKKEEQKYTNDEDIPF